jgi:hypothetical protein
MPLPLVDRGVVGLVIGAVKRHPLAAPQLPDQLRRLLQTGEPLLRVRPRDAERHLIHGLARPHAEPDPSRVENPQRPHGLGHDARVIPERRRDHARAELHAPGALAHSGQPREAERGVTARVPPRLEVVAHHHAVEAGFLGQDRVLHELARTKLLRRRLVPQLQHSHTSPLTHQLAWNRVTPPRSERLPPSWVWACRQINHGDCSNQPYG